MTAPESARLFIALWPGTKVRFDIAAAAAGLALHGRIIGADNLHATLVFLGQVNSAQRACVDRALASVRGSGFELTLSPVAWRRRGGIVWLAPTDVPAALLELVRSLSAVANACGLAVDERPYRPHVTLARDARRPFAKHVPAPIQWRVGEYCLVESTLARGGSYYAVVSRWPLHAGAC